MHFKCVLPEGRKVKYVIRILFFFTNHSQYWPLYTLVLYNYPRHPGQRVLYKTYVLGLVRFIVHRKYSTNLIFFFCLLQAYISNPHCTAIVEFKSGVVKFRSKNL